MRRSAWPKLVGLHDRLYYQDQLSRLDSGSSLSAPTTPSSRSDGFQPGSMSPKRPSRPGSTDDASTSSFASSSRDRILAICDDFEQIERDVARCTWHLLTGTQRSVAVQMEHKRHKKVKKLLRRKQRRLANLINLTLQQSYPLTPEDCRLRYYQGYHDVACIFLSTLSGTAPVTPRSLLPSDQYASLESMANAMGLDLPAAVLMQISLSHLTDNMKSNFLQLQTALRLALFPLISMMDPEVQHHLNQAEMEPFFAVSWVLTWFSHDIRDTELVKRLFDVFLVSHPLLPLYMSVAMIVHPVNRREVLNTECDFALLHQTLQSLPRNSSMVGWKFRPGDGYVSDDDDETVGTMTDDLVLEEQVADLTFLQNQNNSPTVPKADIPDGVSIESSNLSSLLGGLPRVPFQELIETAISMLQRVPPQQLPDLSARYYGRQTVDAQLKEAPDIHLWKPAPEWSIKRTAPSDFIIKREQKMRSGHKVTRNEKKSNRNEQDEKSPLLSQGVEATVLSERDLAQKYVCENKHSASVVATGYGYFDDVAKRRRQKRRNRMVIGAVGVAAMAIFAGYRVTKLQKEA